MEIWWKRLGIWYFDFFRGINMIYKKISKAQSSRERQLRFLNFTKRDIASEKAYFI